MLISVQRKYEDYLDLSVQGFRQRSCKLGNPVSVEFYKSFFDLFPYVPFGSSYLFDRFDTSRKSQVGCLFIKSSVNASSRKCLNDSTIGDVKDLKPNRLQLFDGWIGELSCDNSTQEGSIEVIIFPDWKQGTLNLLSFVTRVLCISTPSTFDECDGPAALSCRALLLYNEIQVVFVAVLVLPSEFPTLSDSRSWPFFI